MEFLKFNKENEKKLTSLLSTYNSLKEMKRNSFKSDTTVDELIEDFIARNPLFKKWYELDRMVKDYQSKLQQYSSDTYTFMECSRFICLKHVEDDEYDLFDLSTQDRINLSEYDKDKQQYIIDNLKNRHSFIGYVTQDELPLLLQVCKDEDQEIIYNDDDTEEEFDEKCWDELTRCYTIEKEFEKRKNSTQLAKINHIEHEKKLIELLGYSLIGPDKSNCWLIMDQNNKQVGFIQYKETSSKNSQKETSITYGYHTEIDSRNICYKAIRELDESICTPLFCYEIDIKRENNDIDHLEINLGENKELTLWSKTYGIIKFRLTSDEFFLDFQSKTDNFNVKEIIKYNIRNKKLNLPDEYTYILNYCNKDIDLNRVEATGIKGRSITFKSNPSLKERNEVNVIEKSWSDNRLILNHESIVKGSIEEAIKKNEMGRDAFSHFRFLINHILPFKEEVIFIMLGDKAWDYLSLFIPELEKTSEIIMEDNCSDEEKSLAKCKKLNNN